VFVWKLPVKEIVNIILEIAEEIDCVSESWDLEKKFNIKVLNSNTIKTIQIQ